MVKIKLKSIEYYPELTDPDFQKKIYKKKEFFDKKIGKIENNPEKACNPRGFELFQQQKFLKNYISIETPYNGVLLFHSVGSGKTCASVSIAENFKEYVKDNKKKIMILSNKALKENYIKTIYNLDKEKDKIKKNDIVQCTGNTYTLDESDRFLTREQKLRKIRKKIMSYYQFMGYGKFANEVKKRTGWDGRNKFLNEGIIKKIIREYSNRVIIIDEVHNIKKNLESSKTTRFVGNILLNVLKYSKNIKLVLMSATPMFDKPKEIVFILNLLLANDKRELIPNGEIFNTNGDLKKNGRELLFKYSNGYISFFKSDNPYIMPVIIYPNNSVIPNFKYNMNGQKIEKNKRIKFTKCLLSQMGKNQYKYYEEVNNERLKIENSNNNDEKISQSYESQLTQISNMVFPQKNKNMTYGKNGFTETNNGLGAFYISSDKKSKRTLQYKYQPHVLFNKNKKNEKPFLDLDYLGDYSGKIPEIIDYIKKSTGPVIVYSRYIWGGILPLALALEQNGILRYTTNNETSLLSYSPNKLGGGGISPPISFDGGISIKKYKNKKNFKALKYAIYFPNNDYVKTSIQKLVNVINSDSNKDGNEIKVLLGTDAITEGIDFKGIRQIQIMSPWYNLSKNEQIIGRGVRNCSHIRLPISERNVEIFQYVAVANKSASKKKKDEETVDVKNYRISENKDIQIKAVERILKENAIDCQLNEEAHKITRKKISIITSLGVKKSITIGPQPYSRDCDYQKECNFKCRNYVKEKFRPDETTFSINFAKEDIEKAKRIIKKMYKFNYVYNILQIQDTIHKEIPTLKNLYIYKGLDELLNSKIETIYDKFDREGRLIYKGDYYIFQPKSIEYKDIPMYYREHPLTYKIHNIDLTELESKNKEKINNKKMINKEDIISLIDKKIKQILNKYKTFIEKNIPSKYKEYLLVSYALDRLKGEQIVKLLNSMNNKTPYYKSIKKIYDDSVIKIKGKKILKLSEGKQENYYCVENNRLEKCSKKYVELVKNIKSKKKKNKVIGIVDNIFKIIDLRKYTGAETLNKKVSKRSLIQGRSCKTFHLNGLEELYKNFGGNMKYINRKKLDFCFGIEMLLRLKELTNRNIMFFITKI